MRDPYGKILDILNSVPKLANAIKRDSFSIFL